MYIQTEETPNPNALKFLPGETVMPSGTIYVDNAGDADRSPLAVVLFKIGHVEAVFLGADFITVTSYWKPQFFVQNNNFTQRDTINYSCDAHAPPLYLLYSQYTFYC